MQARSKGKFTSGVHIGNDAQLIFLFLTYIHNMYAKYSISATHNSKTPLLAVIMEVKEIYYKSVCLIDLKKREVYKRLISG